MKKILIPAIIIAVLYSSGLYSQESIKINSNLLNSFNYRQGISQNSVKKDIFAQISPGLNSYKKNVSEFCLSNYPLLNIKKDSVEKVELGNPKEKNIWLGAGLSLLLPGAGEFYAKSYIKSAVFFAIEVASWSLYAVYQHKGNKQTTDFQNYANQNWSLQRFGQWLIDNPFHSTGQINVNETNPQTLINEINVCLSDPQNSGEQGFSHTLSDYQTQQYYELIGKYQEFVAGWADAGGITKNNFETTKTPMFIGYSVMRQQANNYYNDATNFSMVVLANHLLSAADAMWSVSIFNKQVGIQSGLRMGTYIDRYTYQVKTIPTLNLQVDF